jgi:hypothetical protein
MNYELASSGAKVCLDAGGVGVNFARAENFPLLTAYNIMCSSKLSERNEGPSRNISGGREYTTML